MLTCGVGDVMRLIIKLFKEGLRRQQSYETLVKSAIRKFLTKAIIV